MGEYTPKPGELWKDVKGYEGLYKVSNFGRVRSMRTGKVLKHQTNRYGEGGLDKVYLFARGKKTGHYVHRLVAAAFLPPEPKDSKLVRKDGDSRNNASANLAWESTLG